jgi:hypothetical protein
MACCPMATEWQGRVVLVSCPESCVQTELRDREYQGRKLNYRRGMEMDVVRVLRPMAAPGGVRRRHGVLLQLLTRCEGRTRRGYMVAACNCCVVPYPDSVLNG